MPTIGEALIARLEAHGVTHIFGIPGVHTVELYRGIATSRITHITPRHEQGAGFMADGYARTSGRPGVALVITGPGLTNTLTPMAQARADSVPILVISSVGHSLETGKGTGALHELPDQLALSKTVSIEAKQIDTPEDLIPAIDAAFAQMATARGGPHHLQIPIDKAKKSHPKPSKTVDRKQAPAIPKPKLKALAESLMSAKRPLLLVGGGAKRADAVIGRLAEKLDAPVVTTVNARGVMHRHPLLIPASPSLQAVRAAIAEADYVLALGTEFGPTDYDMYATGTAPEIKRLARIDICADQLAKHDAELKLQGDAVKAAETLVHLITDKPIADATQRAETARRAAWNELSSDYRDMVDMLSVIRAERPNAMIVGDSTQPVYAGNLYYDHDRPGGWFNAATGYGALGYAIPAAIGAQLAAPGASVVALAGDGGAQFTLPDLMTAVQENLPITFIIWNNQGYGEIKHTMQDAGIDVVGCNPSPPLFKSIAESCNMPYRKTAEKPDELAQALRALAGHSGPVMIEIEAQQITS